MRCWRGSIMAAVLLLTVAGCSQSGGGGTTMNDVVSVLPEIGDRDLTVHAVRSIKTVRIHRVAVMQLIDYPDVTEPNSIQEGAAQSLTAQLYSQMELAGGWEMVPDEDVIQAMQKLPPTTRGNLDANALALAREVSADGILYGTVHKYQDRVGYSYAASQPASVAFTLFFADLNTRQIIWRAQFAKTQESLSQNAFNIVNWLHNEGRWVRAVDLATQGVEEATQDLHSQLNLTPNVKYFPVPNTLEPAPKSMDRVLGASETVVFSVEHTRPRVLPSAPSPMASLFPRRCGWRGRQPLHARARALPGQPPAHHFKIYIAQRQLRC